MFAITEQNIEQQLIDKLVAMKYTYRPDIRDRVSLEQNFREKFEKLNRVRLTDAEFARLLEQNISPNVFTCAEQLRQRHTFEREDGTPLYYQLINLKEWCKNEFEVINQLRINTKNSFHRYDIILLINGLPVVQIELKSLQISPRRAMQQIVDYKKDPGNGYTNTLLCFIQIFVVSNRSMTWYFANNNTEHFSFDVDERFLPVYQWADKDNTKITHIDMFAEAFLSKCTLAEIIQRYMVLLQTEQRLIMMRPYQIYAVKAIIDCIEQQRGDGYIWHTTGTGKTLTSFKVSTILKDNPNIDKVLFVVDRKDLDRQTRQEFNRFQPGCVEENTNTETLVRRLLSNDQTNKVIVTTIQKLGLALNEHSKFKKDLEELHNKRIVFIFDECHRSQFGENHKAIRKFFPNAQLFGFTGTPIFEQNATYTTINGTEARMVTTADVFQKQLHAYTIVNAIDDGNVLRFRIEYYKPTSATFEVNKQKVVETILEKHDIVTNHRRFNALFAVSSIDDAIEYYNLFKQYKEKINVACIFSPPYNGNQDIAQLQEDLPQELRDNKTNQEQKRKALQTIIEEYNAKYGTNFDINSFDGYYQDIQKRIKDQKYSDAQKIDITIVVDMLLTGFDSQYLNTIYLDKNLKYHALIQAMSRTNRVLNDLKPWGNIIDFRGQRADIDASIILFSNEARDNVRSIWIAEPASVVADKLKNSFQQLDKFMKAYGLECTPENVFNLRGEEARIGFLERFKDVQRSYTHLNQYSDIDEALRKDIENILPEDVLRAFQGVYLDIVSQIRNSPQNIDGPIQQVDYELVLFDSVLIDYDYIMKLISGFTKNEQVTREQLVEILRSNAKFLDERDEIIEYVQTLHAGQHLTEEEIRTGYENFKSSKYEKLIDAIAKKYGIDANTLQDFIHNTLTRMVFDSEAFVDIMDTLDVDWKTRDEIELEIMKEIKPILKKLALGMEISGLEAYSDV